MFPSIPTKRFNWKPLSAGVLLGAVVAGLMPAWAAHPEVSLAGSNFEIDTNANLKVDDPAPSIDWANVTEIPRADTPSGATDESFGGGTKEDTAVPTVVDGGIPPNKSDLKFFGPYQEGTTGSGFLNLFWSRVQDPSGTTNMDFELNKRQCTPGQTPPDPDCSANGLTPIRSAGDFLIQYDLANGGTNPLLFLSTWNPTTGACEAGSPPCWGPKVNLTASGNATGSINTSAISAADSDGLGAQSARTFGEAQIRLTALFPPTTPPQCAALGSAYLKSRSSDSFTSALKDFVPPVAVNISNCGSVKITKTDDAGTLLAGATFELYKDNAPLGGTRGAEDTATGQTCTTTLPTGMCTIINVLQGPYWVVETVTPPGHDTAADQLVNVTADAQVSVTFIDPRQRGAIQVTKTAKHKGPSGSANLVATFTVTQGVNTIGTITTNSSGIGCLANLVPGSYTVTETTVPGGYRAPAAQTVTVPANGTCATGFLNVPFVNTPLSDITVSFNPQVMGGTGARISCTGLTPTTPDQTPNAFDDTSETFEDLLPGTTAAPTIYNCTVEIDP